MILNIVIADAEVREYCVYYLMLLCTYYACPVIILARLAPSEYIIIRSK
jgi:hypothetical protein